ncbi:hypothetical protein Tco_0812511, partial [Tanacetum coccineum]
LPASEPLGFEIAIIRIAGEMGMVVATVTLFWRFLCRVCVYVQEDAGAIAAGKPALALRESSEMKLHLSQLLVFCIDNGTCKLQPQYVINDLHDSFWSKWCQKLMLQRNVTNIFQAHMRDRCAPGAS